MKVLSWNIWGGKYLPDILSFLQDTNADIIGIQEVVQDPDGKNNTAQIIAEKLGYNWVFEKTIAWEENGKILDWGNGILSKFPILTSKVHALSEEEKRIALQADIQINKKIFHIFSTHLVHTHQEQSDIQDLQADSLLDILPQERTILMGDFNALPDSYPVQKVGRFFYQTNEQLLPTWSVYPEGCPGCLPDGINWTLDYLFLSKDLKSKNFSVGQLKASDHLPISIEISL